LKPFLTLAHAHTAEGTRLSLHEHDGKYYLHLNGRTLMSTGATLSEQKLAELACKSFGRDRAPRILIGGLGFGFTLRRVLELVGPNATVDVAELFSEVVAWNREFLCAVNGRLLDDVRVAVFVVDVYDFLQRRDKDCYDAILLDVDNGPIAMVQPRNSHLYHQRGLHRIARALKPGGRVAFWSATEERPFAQRLTAAGFEVRTVEVKGNKGARHAFHRIYVATRLASPKTRGRDAKAS
jgi:spermidine synthase